MDYKFSLVLRELVIGMVNAMFMAYAEETKTVRDEAIEAEHDAFDAKLNEFIEYLRCESPLS